MRIENLQRKPLARSDVFKISWNGEDIDAYPGETILGAITAHGDRVLRLSSSTREPRGMFCGIGFCYDCVVTINGVSNIRACVVLAEPGMVVESASPDNRYGSE